jgi:transposase
MIKLSDVKGAPQYRERVRHRLVILAYAGTHGPTAAGRRYGVSVRTVRRWRKRWRGEGMNGLVPRYPHRRQRRITVEVLELIRHARQELAYGAARTRLWLLRPHRVPLTTGTLQRIFVDLGLPYLRRTRKRAPHQLKLFEKLEPGDSVQVDVKFVKIRDRFAFEFALAVEAAGIRHRYIQPRRPQQNGKVERSHRIDNEEFWSRHTFQTSTRQPWRCALGKRRTTTTGGRSP